MTSKMSKSKKSAPKKRKREETDVFKWKGQAEEELKALWAKGFRDAKKIVEAKDSFFAAVPPARIAAKIRSMKARNQLKGAGPTTKKLPKRRRFVLFSPVFVAIYFRSIKLVLDALGEEEAEDDLEDEEESDEKGEPSPESKGIVVWHVVQDDVKLTLLVPKLSPMLTFSVSCTSECVKLGWATQPLPPLRDLTTLEVKGDVKSLIESTLPSRFEGEIVIPTARPVDVSLWTVRYRAGSNWGSVPMYRDVPAVAARGDIPAVPAGREVIPGLSWFFFSFPFEQATSEGAMDTSF